MSNITNNFLGRGLVFPIELDDTGKAVTKTGFELIESSLRIILSWAVGTRFFLGEFGSRIEELLEEPNNAVLRSVVKTFIIEAISNWEPRIELLEATVINKKDNILYLKLDYKIVNTKTERSFIFPYYSQITQ